MVSWVLGLPRRVLDSSTPFSMYLMTALTAPRHHGAKVPVDSGCSRLRDRCLAMSTSVSLATWPTTGFCQAPRSLGEVLGDCTLDELTGLGLLACRYWSAEGVSYECSVGDAT